MKLSDAQKGLLAGLSIAFNVFALLLLLFPMGATPEAQRWTVFTVIALDTALELLVVRRLMGTFWGGFSLLANLIALVVLLVPLGLHPNNVRLIVGIVLAADLFVEVLAFPRHHTKKAR